MGSIIINRKNVRIRRERHIRAKGQVWVCARDFMEAAGVHTPRSLIGDFLAEHLGADAVQTLKSRNSAGDIHRLIFVHAEGLQDLLRLYLNGPLHNTAISALSCISMAYSVSFSNPVPVTQKVEPEVGRKVSTYDFNGLSLRVVKIDGEPWFVGKDVYSVLYGRTTGLSYITSILGEDERLVIKRQREADFLSQLFEGKASRIALLSESGLNKLIMRSDKAEAKPFQEWVTRDVLPSIRKNGSYSLTDGVEAQTTAVSGEVLPPEGLIEKSFKALVLKRHGESLTRIKNLRAELEYEEASVLRDAKMLELLAA